MGDGESGGAVGRWGGLELVHSMATHLGFDGAGCDLVEGHMSVRCGDCASGTMGRGWRDRTTYRASHSRSRSPA